MTSKRANAALAAACLSLFVATPAAGGNLSSFVSNNGSDANACEIDHPCRTFARAVTQTSSGGTISCLDSGRYIDDVTDTPTETIIDRTMTIDCAGTDSSADSFIVAGTGIIVTIRNLYLNRSDLAPGITFFGGAALIVENVHIKNTPGAGINFAPSAGAYLAVRNTLIEQNVEAGTAGIVIQPTAGTSRVELNKVRVIGYVGGVQASPANGAQVSLEMRQSQLSSNRNFGFVSAGDVVATIDSSTITNNANIGVYSSGGSKSWVYVSNSTIAGNNIGWAFATGSNLVSYKNNNVANVSPFGGPSAIVAQQ